MTLTYLEAIVTLAQPGGNAPARAWFEGQGFRTVNMVGGLLITGSGSLFQTVFGVKESFLDRQDVDRQLPIPQPLGQWVESIVVRRLPTLHV